MLWLTINRADKGNAIPYYVRDRLIAALPRRARRPRRPRDRADRRRRAALLHRRRPVGPPAARSPSPTARPTWSSAPRSHMMRIGFQRLMEAMLRLPEAGDRRAQRHRGRRRRDVRARGRPRDRGRHREASSRCSCGAGLDPRRRRRVPAAAHRRHAQGQGARSSSATTCPRPTRERSASSTRSCPRPSSHAATKEWAERLAAGRPRRSAGRRSCCTTRPSSRAAISSRRRRCSSSSTRRPSTRARASAAFRERRDAGVEGLVSPTLDQGPRPRSSASARPTFGKGLPDTELSLACQAISLALDDAGIAPSEVDGLASFTMEPNREVDVARNVGLGDITFFSQVGYGGGAGCGVVGHAAMAVATGQCEVAVAWRARKRAVDGEPAVGAGRGAARRTPASGPGRSACSARSTRSRCSPAATCTSTAARATTSPTSRSRSASTPTRNPNVDDGPQAADPRATT